MKTELVIKGYWVMALKKNASPGTKPKRISRVFHVKQAAEAFKIEADKLRIYENTSVQEVLGAEPKAA